MLYIVTTLKPGSNNGSNRFMAALANYLSENRDLKHKVSLQIYNIIPVKKLFLKKILEEKNPWGFLKEILDKIQTYINKKTLEKAQKNPKNSLLIIHPQHFGFPETLELFNKWTGKIFLYVLDNGFFCVASYNHKNRENVPCFECLGGNLAPMKQNKCEIAPNPDQNALKYMKELQKLVREGKISLLAQNENQKKLLKRHFGGEMEIPVIGLWTDDIEECFKNLKNKKIANTMNSSFDVVLHAGFHGAKGAKWLLDVAKHCPEIKFLFPTVNTKREVRLEKELPGNVTFRGIYWESGLADEIKRAKFVCVPSLWSAPIEGAVVKSIAVGNKVIAVKNETAFCDEIPDNVIIKLPQDPVKAAQKLRELINNYGEVDLEAKNKWLKEFYNNNSECMNKMIKEHL